MVLPRISVVIPTFNQSGYLAEALDSVLTQTFADYEIIVVDDGSTDGTASLLRTYGDRIRVISQDNRGAGAARNRGLETACGRYIAFLDHDDIWHPDKLKVQYEFMVAHPAAVGCSVPYSFSNAAWKPAFDLRIRGDDGIVAGALQRYGEGHMFVLSSIMMIDALKVGDLRYEVDKDSIDDVALLIRLLLRGPYGIAGDAPLATYRIHASNSSNSAHRLLKGIEGLRSIERSNGFGPSAPRDRDAINSRLSAIGRSTLMAQAALGLRARALRGYIAELPHQLRARRFRFLFLFLLALAVPTRLLNRMGRFDVND